MPYSVGERGSYGCSGYPVVKDGTNEVMGCHDSAAMAQNQITAINMSEAESSKKRLKSGVEGFEPASRADSVIFPPIRRKPSGRGGSVDSAAGAMSTTAGGTSMGSKSNYNDNTGDWFNAKPIPETSAFQNEVETRNNISREIGKEHMEIKEGDFVMGMTSEGIAHGRVEHIMWEGGTLGQPGTEYAIESMPPENPAMSVRIFEEEDGEWMPTPYSIGMMYQDAQIIDPETHTMNDDYDKDLELIEKQDGYVPPASLRSAARKALKFKEDGKAVGAGTPVGWTRARQLANGERLSLETVKRMYSYFSRHEVDKKGKDWANQANPSKGYVMWLAWGGDAGFSWSRKIVNQNKEKSLFSNFGKDYTKTERLGEIFKADSVRVGQMVSWNSSGGRAQGKVKRIITSGSYNVPDSDFVIDGTEDNPAVVITLYRDGKPTDTTVAHRRSTLRAL